MKRNEFQLWTAGKYLQVVHAPERAWAFRSWWNLYRMVRVCVTHLEAFLLAEDSFHLKSAS